MGAMQIADTGDDEEEEDEGISTVIVQQEDNTHKKVCTHCSVHSVATAYRDT